MLRNIGIGPSLAIGGARSMTFQVGQVATTGRMGGLANGAGMAWPLGGCQNLARTWSCAGPTSEPVLLGPFQDHVTQ